MLFMSDPWANGRECHRPSVVDALEEDEEETAALLWSSEFLLFRANFPSLSPSLRSAYVRWDKSERGKGKKV